MAMVRSQRVWNLYRSLEVRETSHLLGCSRYYSSALINVPKLNLQSSCLHKGHNALLHSLGNAKTLCTTMADELLVSLTCTRSASTNVHASPNAGQKAFSIVMSSPGIIFDPYTTPDPISIWQRFFTTSGWKRTKEDIMLELKSAFVIAKLKKIGYSRRQVYEEILGLYKKINTFTANGNKKLLRKMLTDKMFSALKNEIKRRESKWSTIQWEMVEPIVKMKTLRARWICIDRTDINRAFVQITVEFLSKQKFEAYDSRGNVVAGGKDKEVLVRDVWVFERSLFQTGARWLLCARLSL